MASECYQMLKAAFGKTGYESFQDIEGFSRFKEGGGGEGGRLDHRLMMTNAWVEQCPVQRQK